jgi:hypothetical protein
MLGPQPLKQFLNRLRQPIICCDLRNPSGVTAGRRHLEESKNGDARRLMLVRDVGVVAGGGELVGFGAGAVLVVWS